MIAPPKPPPRLVEPPHDPDALIEEARRCARRRRRRNGSVAALLLCVGTLLLAFYGWDGGSGRAGPANPSPQLAVAAQSSLMSNGPLTVIRQAKGRGGVYTIGGNGLGRLVVKCDGCLE